MRINWSADPELDLHGMAIDEALWEVEQFLGNAHARGIYSVRIVHGKGSGALRSAIRAWLPRYYLVKSFRRAEEFEGGSGATVVILID